VLASNVEKLVRTLYDQDVEFVIIGGAAAVLGRDVISAIEPIDFEEFGMEAVWRIEVRDFPAFVIIDDKGGDFFARTLPG